MDAVTALARLGGVARLSELVDLTTRRGVRTALDRGLVVRVRRGHYALTDSDRALRTAARYGGTLALTSAAMFHGWAVKQPPALPEVALHRGRRLRGARGARVVWRDDVDLALPATPPLLTVVMCARALPFDEALTIADSALRSGKVTRTELLEAADASRGAGAARVRRVARHSSPDAANAFESVLRAITIELGLSFVPQHPVVAADRELHPDRFDPVRRVVLEADSWEWHTGKQAHVRDCERYNDLSTAGCLVLRFAWDHVMLDRGYVVEVLGRIYGPPRATDVRCDPALSA